MQQHDHDAYQDAIHASLILLNHHIHSTLSSLGLQQKEQPYFICSMALHRNHVLASWAGMQNLPDQEASVETMWTLRGKACHWYALYRFLSISAYKCLQLTHKTKHNEDTTTKGETDINDAYHNYYLLVNTKRKQKRWNII
jgi:hypothetical protein